MSARVYSAAGQSHLPVTSVQPQVSTASDVGAARTQPRNATVSGASVRAMIVVARQMEAAKRANLTRVNRPTVPAEANMTPLQPAPHACKEAAIGVAELAVETGFLAGHDAVADDEGEGDERQ